MAIILRDKFIDGSGVLLKNHTPDVNNTGDVWHDANDRWAINAGAELEQNDNNYVYDSYIDLGNNETRIIIDLYDPTIGFAYFAWRANTAGTQYFSMRQATGGQCNIYTPSGLFDTFSYPSAAVGWHTFEFVVTSTGFKIYGAPRGTDKTLLYTSTSTLYNSNSVIMLLHWTSGLVKYDNLLVTDHVTAAIDYPTPSPGALAKFYKRNYIDKHVSGYELSGDYDNNANVCDRSKITFAQSANFDLDYLPAEMIVDFDGNREIDFVAFRSNGKEIYIQYWDDTLSSWQDFNPAVAFTMADGFIAVELNESVSTSKLRFGILTTLVANSEKKIYEAIATLKITEMNLVRGTSIISESQSNRMQNIVGGSIKVVPYPNHSKMMVEGILNHWQGANYTAYAAIKQWALIDSFLVYLYFSDTIEHLKSDALYLMNDESDDDVSPSEANLLSGVKARIKLVEV